MGSGNQREIRARPGSMLRLKGANVRYGFNYPQVRHDLIACSYFSLTSRAIVETDDMISRS